MAPLATRRERAICWSPLPLAVLRGRARVETLPLYLAYVTSSIGLLAIFAAIYVYITPYRELALIRQGNRAAAISLGGTMVGLSLVLGSVSAHSVGVQDLLLWGVVALGFQVGAFFLANIVLPDIRRGIEAGQESYGIFLAALSLSIGLLNAGAVTY